MSANPGIATNSIRASFLKNTSWLVGGRIFQMLISLFISMITARYLGPANYGVINYTASFCAFFTAFCTLGLNEIIVKELLDHPDEQGKILGTSIAMRLLSSALSVAMIVALVSILNPEDELIRWVAILQCASLVFQSFDIITFWYQSNLMSKRTAILQSIAYTILSAYRVIILVLHKDVKWFAFAVSMDTILMAVFLLIAYNRDHGKLLAFSFTCARRMIAQGHHFILSGLMVAIYGQADKIILGKLMDTEAVGIYSAAITFCGLWTFVLYAIIDSARPIIFSARKTDPNLYRKRIRQLYAAIIWLSIAVAAFLSMFGKWVVLILYGEKFLSAVGALRIVAWYTCFSYLGVARGIWLVCEGYQRYEKKLAFFGAVVNVILNFSMIPSFGILGAAWATLLTQIMTNFLIPLLMKETRQNSVYIMQAFFLHGIFAEKKKTCIPPEKLY